MALMVGYFGNKGTHLEIDKNLNQFKTFGSAGTRPFLALSPSSPILPSGASCVIGTEAACNTLANSVRFWDSSANSTYHALWLTLNQRIAHGLQFNASYTFSHAIDDVSRNSNGIVVPDSVNLANSKGNSDYDARHRFVISTIYNLPFKANRFVSGWELATIGQYQTGNPFDVVLASANITGAGNTVTPFVLGPIVTTDNPLGQWIVPLPGTGIGTANPANYTNTFGAPTTTLGTLARNTLYGPGFANIDAAVVKNTKITERLNFQIRADAFDLLNHPNYGQPGRVLSLPTSTNFGIISSTRTPPGDFGSSRQIQLAAKIQF